VRWTGDLLVGKVGATMTADEGHEAAKLVALSMCASLKEELGDLDKVKKLVKAPSPYAIVTA